MRINPSTTRPVGITMKAFFGVCGSIGLLIIAMLVVLTLVGDSGHTGGDPFVTYWYFLLLLGLSAIASIVFWRKTPLRKAALFSLAVALSGILLVAFLDSTNLLVQYEIWVRRGMPERGGGLWLLWK